MTKSWAAFLIPFIATIFSTEANTEKVTIGIVLWRSDVSEYQAGTKGFMDGLKEQGYLEGKTVKFEIRDAGGSYKKPEVAKRDLRKIFKELNKKKIDLVFTLGTVCTLNAIDIIMDKPVVFTAVYDPVSAHIAESWQGSGNNFAGTACKVPLAEQLKVWQTIFPKLKKVGIIYNPGEHNSLIQVNELKELAEQFKFEVVKSPAKYPEKDLGAATLRLKGKAEVVFAPADTMVAAAPEPVVKAALETRTPIVAALETTVEKGALLGLVPDFYALGKQAAEVAAKILKGYKPSNIPIQMPIKPKLVVNLRAAKALNLAVPQAVLNKAKRVIK